MSVAGGEVRCTLLMGEATLDVLEFACGPGVLRQVVAKCGGAPLFVFPLLNDMHMVCMRPSTWPMEERANRIVGVSYMNVSEFGKARRVTLEWVKPPDRDQRNTYCRRHSLLISL